MRRLFLLLSILSFASSNAQITIQTDVLVVGGSTGGTAAGLQSARLGIKTLIVESTPWLGGMLTAAGVSCTDGNDELPSGMWQEFREALYKHYGTRNLFTGWVSETCFEPYVGDSIFKAWAAKEKNLSVKYGWYFDKILKSGNKVVGAQFINKKKEILIVKATLTIDGTDLGDAFASAGAKYDIGMEDKAYSNESMAPGNYLIIQDLTWAAILKDYGAGADKTIARPANYDSTLYFCCCTDAPCKEGKPYNVDAKKMLDYGRIKGNKFMINWPAHGNDFVGNVVDVAPIERERALEGARQKTLGFIYFIQTQLGMKHIGLADEFPSKDKLALMPYHREGRRVVGLVRLTANYLTDPFNQKEALYRTGISVGDYPVDHHHAPEKRAPGINFPKVPSFNVPLGALIPKDIEGLIVCEKGISVSNIVNGSSRLQPCVLLTGQAAGVLAAKSILYSKSPKDISVRDVQSTLLQSYTFLMPYCDVKTTDKDWIAIQKIGATGILRGTGKPEGWANKTFFYPDSSVSFSDLELGFYKFYKQFPTNRGLKGDPVTYNDLLVFISRTGKSITESQKQKLPSTKILTRREIATLINEILDPFRTEIDIRGAILD